jgi:hypothetical protein
MLIHGLLLSKFRECSAAPPRDNRAATLICRCDPDQRLEAELCVHVKEPIALRAANAYQNSNDGLKSGNKAAR